MKVGYCGECKENYPEPWLNRRVRKTEGDRVWFWYLCDSCASSEQKHESGYFPTIFTGEDFCENDYGTYEKAAVNIANNLAEFLTNNSCEYTPDQIEAVVGIGMIYATLATGVTDE